MKKNIGLLILSFIIALCFYFYVNSKSGQQTYTLMVPVATSNVPADKLVILSSSSQVQVTIKGPQYILQSVATKANTTLDIRIPEDVTNTYSTPITPKDFNFPSGVDVLSIEPQDVTFSLDKVITKKLPVVIPRIGQLSEDFKLASFQVTPDIVEVSGPELELKDKKIVEAEPIDMRSIQEDVDIVTKLRPLGKFTKFKDDSVSVNIAVKPVNVTKEFRGLNIEIKNEVTKVFNVDFKTVDVLLSGPKAMMNDLQIQDVKPYIRIDEDAAKNFMANINVDLPQDVSIVSINPKAIKLKPARN